jgi:nascent polypeptide-associated complex subunit alpha
MGKLPKALREKRKKNQSLRTQGSTAMKGGGKQSKAMNRQMRRKMQSQGVEGMEEIDATKVIIQTGDGDLVIEAPQVIKLNQQGMEIYQVIGSAKKQESGSYNSDAVNDELGDGVINIESDSDLDVEEDLKIEITEQDIQLVSMQTGASAKDAKAALEEANGDLARAIISLKTK